MEADEAGLRARQLKVKGRLKQDDYRSALTLAARLLGSDSYHGTDLVAWLREGNDSSQRVYVYERLLADEIERVMREDLTPPARTHA